MVGTCDKLVLASQNQQEVRMKTKIFTVLAIAVFMVSVMAIGTAKAVTQITAQDAYNMVTTPVGPGELQPVLIDVRTLEEHYWVGNPADEAGNPIAYNISYKLWTSRIDCQTGKPILRTMERLFGAIIRLTFPDRDTPLILMCRSGKRTDDAGEFLETTLGYNYVYEIDRSDKTGRGGFQGSGYSDAYNGYRGYPGRDTSTQSHPSVSWMDTGLPITQKLDCSKIWQEMWR